MDNEEIKVPDQENAENEKKEEKTVVKRSLSGDVRIFVIALLTSIIVVLIYHGTICLIRRFGCGNDQKTCTVQQKQCPPVRNFRKPQFRQRNCDQNYCRHSRETRRNHKHRRNHEVRRNLENTAPEQKNN